MGATSQIEPERPGTILLVDDCSDDVSWVRYAFARCGICNPVQVVDDGDVAISYLLGRGTYADRAQYPLPIFVLLDLMMPRMSGFEVLTFLKTNREFAQLPVIVLSAITDLAQVNKAYQLGALTFMLKPLRAEELTTRFPYLKGFSFISQPAGGRFIKVSPPV